MEVTSKRRITVDIRKNNKVAIPSFVQGDTNVVEFEILDNGVAADLSTVGKVVANYKRPDKHVVTREATYAGNIVSYRMGQEEMEVAGLGEVEIQFFNADYSKRVSTFAVRINVAQSVGEAAELSDELGNTLLQDLLVKADYAEEQAKQAEAAAKSAVTNWLSPVANKAAVDAIAGPKLGDTVQTNDNGFVYRYDGTKWVKTQEYGATALANVNAQLAETTNYLDQYVYNSVDGLKKWRLALGRSTDISYGTHKRTEVVFVGDSITADANAVDRNNGYVNLWRSSIQLATGIAGKGFLGYDVFVGKSGWNYNLKGTNSMTWVGTSTSSKITFTELFSQIDVIYSKQPDGVPGTIKVDGQSKTINCNGEESYHNLSTLFSYASDGLHTIEIEPPTSGKVYIEGFKFYSQDKGVVVHKLGHPGKKASDYLDNPSMIKATIKDFVPDLTVIALGSNDCLQQATLANYKSALDQMVKAGLVTGDVLILSQPPLNDTALTTKYKEYVATARQVAKENSCCHIDMNGKWGSDYQWAFNNKYIADAVHPTQFGHNDITETLRNVLGGLPFRGVLRLLYENPSYGRLSIKKGLLPVDVKIGNRGQDVTVTEGVSSMTINLPDTISYGTLPYTVSIAPNWNTTYWVTNKGYASFMVNFGTPAPSGAKLDWSALRN